MTRVEILTLFRTGRGKPNLAGHCPPLLSLSVSLRVSLQTTGLPTALAYSEWEEAEGRSQVSALEGPRMELCQRRDPAGLREVKASHLRGPKWHMSPLASSLEGKVWRAGARSDFPLCPRRALPGYSFGD